MKKGKSGRSPEKAEKAKAGKGRTIGEYGALHIWHEWLEGVQPASIARWADGIADTSDRRLSARDVERVLAAPPPPAILQDLRYLTGLRVIWIAAQGRINPVTGKEDALTFLFMPRHMRRAGQVRALTNLRLAATRMDPKLVLHPAISEPVEDVSNILKIIIAKFVLSWIADEEGDVRPFTAQELATMARGAAMRPGLSVPDADQEIADAPCA